MAVPGAGSSTASPQTSPTRTAGDVRTIEKKIEKLARGVELEIDYYTDPVTGSGNSHFTYWLTIRDGNIRDKAPGFDGLERPYQMLPTGVENGKVKRERADFLYRRDLSNPGIEDVYLGKFENTTRALIKKYGARIFLDTNVGKFEGPVQKTIIKQN